MLICYDSNDERIQRSGLNVYNRKRDAWNMPMQHGVNLFNTIMLILKYNRLSINHNNLNQDHIIIYLTKKPLQNMRFYSCSDYYNHYSSHNKGKKYA